MPSDATWVPAEPAKDTIGGGAEIGHLGSPGTKKEKSTYQSGLLRRGFRKSRPNIEKGPRKEGGRVPGDEPG